MDLRDASRQSHALGDRSPTPNAKVTTRLTTAVWRTFMVEMQGRPDAQYVRLSLMCKDFVYCKSQTGSQSAQSCFDHSFDGLVQIGSDVRENHLITCAIARY